MNQMTSEQALRNLEQVARGAALNADQHAILAESVRVLRAMIEAGPPE